MSVQERKARERAVRERLIVATARELAEQQGWDAVTTRRLAERIEYSQPVLYSHFRGKREIIGAVALEGAAEMAAGGGGAAPPPPPPPPPPARAPPPPPPPHTPTPHRTRHARGRREFWGAVALAGAAVVAAAGGAGPRRAADGPRERVAALARAYLDFAERNPAVYDAMFQLDGGLAFADEDTPEPLKDAFAALMESLGELAGDGVDPGLFTEVFWACLHGIATLTRAGRLPPECAEQRVELLVDRLAVL
ncbi:TetR/AcrR family transcriptional regulator [Streptomyces atratus]